MSKPLLFLCSSSSITIEDLYYLKDIGKVLNFADATVEQVQQFPSANFIICNLKDENQIDKLKFIEPDRVTSVAVLRKYESVDEKWVQRIRPEYKVKDFSFVRTCKNIYEIINYIKFKSAFKQPDSDSWFWIKKFLILCKCLSNDN